MPVRVSVIPLAGGFSLLAIAEASFLVAAVLLTTASCALTGLPGVGCSRSCCCCVETAFDVNVGVEDGASAIGSAATRSVDTLLPTLLRGGALLAPMGRVIAAPLPPPPPLAPPLHPPAPPFSGAVATVLHHFDATIEDTLTIRKGERVAVVGEEDGEGWVVVCVEGAPTRRGAVPTSYVRVVRATALHDFAATDAETLSMKMDQRVVVGAFGCGQGVGGPPPRHCELC